MNISELVQKVAIATQSQASAVSQARMLCVDEIEQVAGGLPIHTYASTTAGGADGYGGSRRNP
jgi:hypothetical protein